MSFPTSLKNPPAEARYWMPAFYYTDPDTGDVIPYYPSSYYLAIEESWLCPLAAGDGVKVDYRCIVYDEGHNIIDSKDLYNITVRDDKEFVFNWTMGKFNVWYLIVPAAIIGVVVAFRKKRR